ncbi:unnamed protein product [Lampetra planeri]
MRFADEFTGPLAALPSPGSHHLASSQQQRSFGELHTLSRLTAKQQQQPYRLSSSSSSTIASPAAAALSPLQQQQQPPPSTAEWRR